MFTWWPYCPLLIALSVDQRTNDFEVQLTCSFYMLGSGIEAARAAKKRVTSVAESKDDG